MGETSGRHVFDSIYWIFSTGGLLLLPSAHTSSWHGLSRWNQFNSVPNRGRLLPSHPHADTHTLTLSGYPFSFSFLFPSFIFRSFFSAWWNVAELYRSHSQQSGRFRSSRIDGYTLPAYCRASGLRWASPAHHCVFHPFFCLLAAALDEQSGQFTRFGPPVKYRVRRHWHVDGNRSFYPHPLFLSIGDPGPIRILSQHR